MLDLFRAVFLAVGRGGRPSLPKYDLQSVTNLTWLRLYQLKLEFSASWSAVTSWTKLLFPGLPSFNPRRLMEKVARGFSKTAHKEVIVSLTMNLDDIGSGLGILRSTIAYGVAMPSVRLDLSHDAVGEMADMYSSTHGILNCLFPDKPADDWKDVVKKITTQIKGLKSKKKA